MKSSKGIWRFFKIAVAAEVAVAVYPESPEHLGPQTLPNSTQLHSTPFLLIRATAGVSITPARFYQMLYGNEAKRSNTSIFGFSEEIPISGNSSYSFSQNIDISF
jgi:hypothetical protein